MAILKIYGDIGEPMPEMFMGDSNPTISAKDVADFIDANKDAEEIIVRINSRGGDVQEGWTIYDLLTTSGKKITTIGEGKIYSIATIIFMAGSVRKIMHNADGLIHNPFIPEYTLAGAYESTDLLKIAESLAQEESKILDFYAEKTGYDKAKLAEYMKNETKLSAEDMLSMGFATEIVEPVRAFAVFKHKSINNMTTEADKMKIMERFDALVAGDFTKAFSRVPANKNMSKTDTSGNTFTVEKESGEPAVGDVAAPDGTYVMENGDTIVVKDGKIESITPKAATGDDELAKANAEIERLKNELAASNKKVTDMEASVAEMVALKADATALVNELRGLKNSWKPAARTSADGGKNVVDGIDLNRVNEIVNKSKK